MAHFAMFEGLVVDTRGRSVPVRYVGPDACYVVDDDGFLRHIDAALVDRQVLAAIKEQVEQHRELAVAGMLELLGQDDLFTKAALESSIDRIDQMAGQQPLPEEVRQWLGMLGFRIVIDEQGNVVEIQMPAGGMDEE